MLFKLFLFKIVLVITMDSNNICKFIPVSASESLNTLRFVLETDQEIMTTPCALRENRAILVTKGSGDFYFDAFTLSATSGDLLFGFSGETFKTLIKDELEYMYIDFEGSRGDNLFGRFGVQKNNRTFSGFDGLLPLWKESLARADAQTIDLLAEGILLLTFAKIHPAVTKSKTMISLLIEELDNRFNDPTISISTLAEEMAYNPKYLSHLFKKEMGISFSEYLRNTRIKYAASLFDAGLDSVKNVGLLSGFTDPLYFSNVFKKTVGLSPKEYIGSKQKYN